ncbi:hypothetical protein R1flu_009332 [Riccia fluitans]|uniref:Uncharacterized protein n=1 Tax=Riccia fluitans TaxID=41844 RepID=A0ABD1Z1S5_9MARC
MYCVPCPPHHPFYLVRTDRSAGTGTASVVASVDFDDSFWRRGHNTQKVWQIGGLRVTLPAVQGGLVFCADDEMEKCRVRLMGRPTSSSKRAQRERLLLMLAVHTHIV